jgi:hypothetical protein
MKISVLFILATASIACGESYYELQMSVKNTFYGGLALAVAGNMNPGVTASIEPIKRVNKYFGAGGHIDYTWLSVANLPEKMGAGNHMFDISFVPKAFIPVGYEKEFSFEADPGVYGVYFYYSEGGYFDSIFKVYFGLTSAAAFSIGSFSFMFKSKVVFADFSFERASLANWVAFCAGVTL